MSHGNDSSGRPGGRGGQGRPGNRGRSSGGPGASGRGRDSGRGGPGRSSERRGGSGRDSGRGGGTGDSRRRGAGGPQRRQGSGPRRDERRGYDRTEDQKIYDGPPIPDDVSAKDLDRAARAELQGLPDKLADRVARHLVMAGALLYDDPETAHKHSLAARARAMRVGIVREAAGETAYACGRWNEALAEFRAARRMTGRVIYAPMMADCERALRRPEKALEYDKPEIRNKLDEAGNVELTIVIAGARRDMRQFEAALQLLETEPLNSKGRGDWLARLRYAYADTLLDMGRRDEAITWFHRVVAVDGDQVTDAEDRLADLEG